jgi:ribosomal protein L16/L10AE
MTRVQTGAFLFELNCPNEALAKTALTIASSKLPIATTLVIKQ